VRLWAEKTKEVKNDQRALNELINPRQKRLRPGIMLEAEGWPPSFCPGPVRLDDWSGGRLNPVLVQGDLTTETTGN